MILLWLGWLRAIKTCHKTLISDHTLHFHNYKVHNRNTGSPGPKRLHGLNKDLGLWCYSSRSGNEWKLPTSSTDWWHNNDHYVTWLSTFSRFGMLIWIFTTVRNGSVVVGVHMETFRLFHFWNVGPNVNFGRISKNTHKRSNKTFATKPNGQIFTIKTPKASLC